MDIEIEISNWSSHILTALVEEEGCSDFFRELASVELSRRGEAVTLTEESLSALFNCNAPNAAQIHLLGLHPLRTGWMKRLYGTEIPRELYSKLLSLKGRRPQGTARKEWRRASVN